LCDDSGCAGAETGPEWQIGGEPATGNQPKAARGRIGFAPEWRQAGQIVVRNGTWEVDLELAAGLNLGILLGYGLIILGLVILLIGLVWSGTRRLRNLSDDPRVIRVMILAGLALAAAGVIVGAIGVRAT
jgi:hypothetical protein